MPVAVGSPRDAKYRRALEQYQQRPNQLLAGQDSIYGPPGQAPDYDWPVPRGRPFPVENRNYVQDTQLVLIGQDSIYGAPGQAPVYDTSLPPRGAPRPIEHRTWTQSLVDKFFVFVESLPFNQMSWPVPPGAAPHRENQTFLHQVDRQLIGQDSIYGGPGQAPQYIWIVPNGRSFPTENRGFILDKPNQLIGQDAIYGAPGQAPVYSTELPPRAPASRENRTWIQNLLESVLGVVQAPFNQLHWPLPWSRESARENRTFTLNGTRYIGHDRIYGEDGQVPTYDTNLPPIGRPHPITNRTWIRELVTKFLSLTPFSQLDWPVPIGRAPHRANRTHTDSIARLIGQDRIYGAPGQAPVYSTALPPRGARPANALRSWLQSLVHRFFFQPLARASYAETSLNARTADVTMDMRSATLTLDARVASATLDQRTAETNMNARSGDVSMDTRSSADTLDERRSDTNIEQGRS